MDTVFKSQPIYETAQLIFTRRKGVDIVPDERVLQQIFQNFDPHKKLSIYVAAGKLGTCKSSHQNVFLKRITNNLSNQSAPFDVQQVVTTLTQGVWVYPHPLSVPDQPDVQILLIDVEGMDSVKDADKDDTLLNLMKLFTFGMILSSVFSLHTETKPDQNSLDILKKAFDVCRIFKSQLNIEPPKLFLLLKDAEPMLYADAIQDLKGKIDKQFQNYQEERNQLRIKAKGEPPKNFRDSTSRDCSQLEGTPYLQLVDELIQVISQSPKLDPMTANSPITLRGFTELVKTACDLLNNKDFEGNLIAAIDYIKLERLNQIYTENLKQCVETSLERAKTESLEVSPGDFEAKIAAYVNECIAAFGNQVSQSIKYSATIKNWTEKHQAIFRATTSSMGAKEIFTRRKIAAEENEELKKQHEEKLQQQMDLTEKAKKSAENLQNQVIKMGQEHKEEMEKSQKEFDEKLRKAAQEALERLRVEEKKGEAMKEEHKKNLEDLGKSYEARLIERSKELVAERKKDLEKHAQEMERLQQKLTIELEKVGKDREEKQREIERRLHEREIAWNKEDCERKLAYEKELYQLKNQLNEVQASKNKSEGSGIFGFLTGIFTEPLKGLATGIVKAFTK